MACMHGCPRQVPFLDMPPGIIPALPAPGEGGSSSSPREPQRLEKDRERGTKVRFTWRLENLVAFRPILDTRKVFSRCALLNRRS